MKAEAIATIVKNIEGGATTNVIDERGEVDNRVIAKGFIKDVSVQQGTAYIYLNTGYTIILLPVLEGVKE